MAENYSNVNQTTKDELKDELKRFFEPGGFFGFFLSLWRKFRLGGLYQSYVDYDSAPIPNNFGKLAKQLDLAPETRLSTELKSLRTSILEASSHSSGLSSSSLFELRGSHIRGTDYTGQGQAAPQLPSRGSAPDLFTPENLGSFRASPKGPTASDSGSTASSGRNSADLFQPADLSTENLLATRPQELEPGERPSAPSPRSTHGFLGNLLNRKKPPRPRNDIGLKQEEAATLDECLTKLAGACFILTEEQYSEIEKLPTDKRENAFKKALFEDEQKLIASFRSITGIGKEQISDKKALPIIKHLFKVYQDHLADPNENESKEEQQDRVLRFINQTKNKGFDINKLRNTQNRIIEFEKKANGIESLETVDQPLAEFYKNLNEHLAQSQGTDMLARVSTFFEASSDTQAFQDVYNIINQESSMEQANINNPLTERLIQSHEAEIATRGGNLEVIATLRDKFIELYEQDPATVTINGKEVTLPATRAEFDKLSKDWSEASKEAANQAYYKHQTHTAYRTLLAPNPWCTAATFSVPIGDGHGIIFMRDPAVEGNPKTTQKLIAAMAIEIEKKPANQQEELYGNLSSALSEIGRAHNNDHEQDDGLADHPSCAAGLLSRLQHPLRSLFPENLTADVNIIRVEIIEFKRKQYMSKLDGLTMNQLMAVENFQNIALDMGNTEEIEQILKNFTDDEKDSELGKLLSYSLEAVKAENSKDAGLDGLLYTTEDLINDICLFVDDPIKEIITTEAFDKDKILELLKDQDMPDLNDLIVDIENKLVTKRNGPYTLCQKLIRHKICPQFEITREAREEFSAELQSKYGESYSENPELTGLFNTKLNVNDTLGDLELENALTAKANALEEEEKLKAAQEQEPVEPPASFRGRV